MPSLDPYRLILFGFSLIITLVFCAIPMVHASSPPNESSAQMLSLRDENGMDMTMDGSMSLASGSMLPYLHFTIGGDILWFQGWVPQTKGSMLGACFGLFLLALVERWITSCRRLMEAFWAQRAQIAYTNKLKETKQIAPAASVKNALMMRRAPPFIPAHDLVRGIMHIGQAALNFAFMLAVIAVHTRTLTMAATLRKFISVLFMINAASLVYTICGAAPTQSSPSGYGSSSSGEPEGKAGLLGKFDRPWILDVNEHIKLSESDKQVFSKTLTGVDVGLAMRGVVRGSRCKGIGMLMADYKEHKASELVAKALMEPIDDDYFEVKVLKTLTDLYIDSGMVSGWPTPGPSPVIIMKKVPGQPIKNYPAYRLANKEEKTAMHKKLQEMVCSQVVKWALEHKLLLADLHQGNILVNLEETTIKSMQIIDFGYPGVFALASNAKEADVHSWCTARFADKWAI
ncbi:hypothetical protein D9757_013218 [Collybiopsis confluens]|uniref:Copper transport protein n=1 Tax=Collybiopsis confluens TaxID=2823264 RepID=A0A8H5GA92_9AGAR|nr:hypothetical protein D9757_013218 [Collybiopsis confluens]